MYFIPIITLFIFQTKKMKILINYANIEYDSARKWNTYSGHHIAKFDKIYTFSPNDVEDDFRTANSKIFAEQRGNGLWLWKPYIINKVMNDIQDGDIIFYCDAGSFFIRNPQAIFNKLTFKSPLFVCDIPLLESCFTKPACFERMGLTEEKYKASNQIIATYFCFLVTPITRKFMKEWLSLCCDFELLSPAGLGKFDVPTRNFKESFVAHREDQSIFSLLCKKYKVSPHRDISQRGKHPETYKSPFYAYKVPTHPNDKYKPIIFLHKSPCLNFKWFIRYVYHRIKSKYSSL